MTCFRTTLTAIVLLAAAGGARAEATCESVRTDLTGQNVFGEQTMKELAEDARAGNCDAAAFLTRRARDAQGFVATHCQNAKDLQDIAANQLSIGQRTLKTPACQD